MNTTSPMSMTNCFPSPLNSLTKMKKTALFSLLLFMVGANAQTVPNPIPATEIAPCVGNTTKSFDVLEKSVVFNAVGVNINKYDWSNPTVNCHINETVKKYKGSRSMKTIGWALLGAGLGFVALGIAQEASQKTYYGVTAGSSGTGFIVAGALSFGSGIGCLIGGGSAKKKSDHHLSQVAEYYRTKGLY